MLGSVALCIVALFTASVIAADPPAAAPTPHTRIELPPSDTTAGYIALLLVNEAPFPGERGWVSEADSKAAMLQILWVLESRLKYVPDGYTQAQIASTQCKTIIDVITAGGEKGQVDGFYRDSAGKPVTVPRVRERIDYLVQCANKGEPGRFARLLLYAGELCTAYAKGGMDGADRYAVLQDVNSVPVTGRAYSWMTDQDCYNPGGAFVRIPNTDDGSLGGNRFFTLRRVP